MQKKANVSLQDQTCQYLGLHDDPDTHMTFTSPLNNCHRGRTSAPVLLNHQGSYCLQENHVNCPVYRQGADKTFPRELRGRSAKRSEYTYPVFRKRKCTWLLWSSMIVLVILLGLGYWLSGIGGSLVAVFSPTPTQLPSASKTPIPALITSLPSHSPTFIPSATPGLVQTSTVTPFPTLTSTLDQEFSLSLTSQAIIPSLSPTPTEISPHSLEVPIGSVQKYLIHQVVTGENLTGLAAMYKTSIEAIMKVNIALKVPIREDSIVVMPLDISNPDGLPAFEPYQVKEDQIVVESLAAELKTDPTLLKYFNLYNDGERLREGDWILIPRVRQEVP